jgi:hypothetical protein
MELENKREKEIRKKRIKELPGPTAFISAHSLFPSDARAWPSWLLARTVSYQRDPHGRCLRPLVTDRSELGGRAANGVRGPRGLTGAAARRNRGARAYPRSRPAIRTGHETPSPSSGQRRRTTGTTCVGENREEREGVATAVARHCRRWGLAGEPISFAAL